VTPNPGFMVNVRLQVEYLKNGALVDKFTIEQIGDHNQSIELYHFQ